MLIGWARLHWIGFPLKTDFEKEFQKRIPSEFDLNINRQNQQTKKRSLFVEKQKYFSDQKRIDSHCENSTGSPHIRLEYE